MENRSDTFWLRHTESEYSLRHVKTLERRVTVCVSLRPND